MAHHNDDTKSTDLASNDSLRLTRQFCLCSNRFSGRLRVSILNLSEPDDEVPDARRRNMRAVRDRNTKPEMIVRRMLHRLGFRFRLHRADLPGRPDIVFPSRRKVIEVRGCFWHCHSRPDCPKAGLPATRRSWWEAKLASNVDRDQRNLAALKAAGWGVLEVWECELRNPEKVSDRLKVYLDGDRRSAQSQGLEHDADHDSCSHASAIGFGE